MTTTETTLNFLRTNIKTQFNAPRMDIDRAVKKDKDIWEWIFTDRDTGEVLSKYKNHPDIRALSNSDGRTIYCPPELYDFALRMREVMPYVDFYIHDYYLDNFYQTMKVGTLNVHRPGDVKVMGIIGYGHTGLISGRRPTRNSPVKSHYIVYTPYIENNKYREDSDAHFMRASKSLDLAMKNVKKFLRPWSPIDIACTYQSDFERKVRQKFNVLRSSTHASEYSLGRHVGAMARLIKDLIDKKTENIMDAKLQERLDNFLSEEEAMRKELDKSIDSTFVLVRHDGAVDSLKFSAVNADSSMTCRSTEVKKYPSVDALPDELQGAISVMSMLDKGEYVEDVGMKTNDRTYWVHHEDN